MKQIKITLIILITIRVSQANAFLDSSEKFSIEEKNILKGITSKLNQPLSFDSPRVSSECRKASIEFMNQLRDFELWALQMHDASAKLPSGILNGNSLQYGDFDQCLSSRSPNGKFRGKYCLAYAQLTLPDEFLLMKHIKENFVFLEAFRSTFDEVTWIVPRSSEIRWGLCVPSICTSHDVKLAYSEFINSICNGSNIEFEVEVKSNQCQTDDDDWISSLDYATKATIFLLIAYLTFIIGASLYDKTTRDEARNRWLMSFSIFRNVKDIFSYEPSGNEIASLHGIRFINMILLFLAHKTMVMFYNPIVNGGYIKNLTEGYVSTPMSAAYIYTDIFMMLAGLLVSRSTLGKLQNGRKINFRNEIFGRYLRMMPPLAAVVMFSTFVLPHIGAGPLWSLHTDQADVCRKTWWRNLLMVHNWFGIQNACLPQTHHIATDFFLFVVSLFLIAFLHKHPRMGIIGIASLGIASTVGRFYVTYHKQLPVYLYRGVSIRQIIECADNMYFIPPHRFTSYAIGLLLGYILTIYKHIKLNRSQLIFGHILSSTFFAFTIWSLVSNLKMNLLNQAILCTFGSMSFCFFFGWWILTSQFGSRNIIVRFLELKCFKISTNLAYGFYLMQFTVLYYNVSVRRAPILGSIYGTIIDLNELLVVVFAAVIWTICFETPFGHIKKILLDDKVLKTKLT